LTVVPLAVPPDETYSTPLVMPMGSSVVPTPLPPDEMFTVPLSMVLVIVPPDNTFSVPPPPNDDAVAGLAR